MVSTGLVQMEVINAHTLTDFLKVTCSIVTRRREVKMRNLKKRK